MYRPILLDVYCTLRVPIQPLATIRNKTTILFTNKFTGRSRYICAHLENPTHQTVHLSMSFADANTVRGICSQFDMSWMKFKKFWLSQLQVWILLFECAVCFQNCHGKVAVLHCLLSSFITSYNTHIPTLMTAVYCRTLVVGHCALTRMTCGSCSCHARIINSVTGVSRPPVPDYGTTFHLDYGGRDLPLTLSKSL